MGDNYQVKDATSAIISKASKDLGGGLQADKQVAIDSAGNEILGTVADALIGAGAAGSISAKLRAISRDIVANIVLAAGGNVVGKFGVDQTTPGVTDSVTVKPQGFSAQGYNATGGAGGGVVRPNDTTAYAAGDVVGGVITFANLAPSAGGEIIITSGLLRINDTGLISGEAAYRLHLYGVTPPSALADNAGWDLSAGDRAAYLGFLDLGSPVDLGSTLFVQNDGINAQRKAAGSSVFGYLVTNGAYTPTANRVYVPELHAVAA